MLRIGLTGHRGFIGRKVLSRLSAEGHDVIPYDKSLISFGDYREDGLDKYHEIKDCDLIIHLAGKNKGTDRDIIATNVFGTFSLLSYCHFKGKPIMLAGSDYKNDGAYKHSKDTMKALCRSYGFIDGYTSCTLNLPKVIGPGCKPGYNSFVTTLAWAQATNQLIIYERKISNLNEQLELIHVDDVCDSIVDLIENPCSGFTEYEFTKYDGKFNISMQEILDSIKGNNVHKSSVMLQDLVQWYKENPNGESK